MQVNNKGQVLHQTDGDAVNGLFVTGWIKRGPSGVIGTNKGDSDETVQTCLGYLESQSPKGTSSNDVQAILDQKELRTVSFSDWKRIDAIEVERGQEQGKPREKFTNVDDIFKALEQA